MMHVLKSIASLFKKKVDWILLDQKEIGMFACAYYIT